MDLKHEKNSFQCSLANAFGICVCVCVYMSESTIAQLCTNMCSEMFVDSWLCMHLSKHKCYNYNYNNNYNLQSTRRCKQQDSKTR